MRSSILSNYADLASARLQQAKFYLKHTRCGKYLISLATKIQSFVRSFFSQTTTTTKPSTSSVTPVPSTTTTTKTSDVGTQLLASDTPKATVTPQVEPQATAPSTSTTLLPQSLTQEEELTCMLLKKYEVSQQCWIFVPPQTTFKQTLKLQEGVGACLYPGIGSWKIHISICPNQMKDAIPIIMKRFLDPEAPILGFKMASSKLLQEAHQIGKEFALIFAEEEEKQEGIPKIKAWLTQLAHDLQQAGIQPEEGKMLTIESKEEIAKLDDSVAEKMNLSEYKFDRTIPNPAGPAYFHYRNELFAYVKNWNTGYGKDNKQVSEDQLKTILRSQPHLAHNLTNDPDPFVTLTLGSSTLPPTVSPEQEQTLRALLLKTYQTQEACWICVPPDFATTSIISTNEKETYDYKGAGQWEMDISIQQEHMEAAIPILLKRFLDPQAPTLGFKMASSKLLQAPHHIGREFALIFAQNEEEQAGIPRIKAWLTQLALDLKQAGIEPEKGKMLTIESKEEIAQLDDSVPEKMSLSEYKFVRAIPSLSGLNYFHYRNAWVSCPKDGRAATYCPDLLNRKFIQKRDISGLLMGQPLLAHNLGGAADPFIGAAIP